MKRKEDLAVALDAIERKISNLNMQIVKGNNDHNLENEVKKYLEIKRKILNGNEEIIREIIKNRNVL